MVSIPALSPSRHLIPSSSNQQLFIMLESGELIMARTDSTQFKVIARKQILPFGVRAFPAYSNGHFIARSPGQLVCWKFEN